MKNLFALLLMAVTVAHGSVAQTVDKATKKDLKMMRRSAARENNAKSDNGAKSARELRKMQKKEDKSDTKAAKQK